MDGYRWEYSSLAWVGNKLWAAIVDPLLRLFAYDDLTLLRRTRGVIQLTVLFAIFLLPISIFYQPDRTITASGLLFDIAGALRLFLLEEIQSAIAGFKPNKYGNLPSVATRELVMPEASGPYDATSKPMSLFYYKSRGVFLLFIGFVLQLVALLFA